MPRNPSTLVHCAYCGKPKWVYPSRATRFPRSFCNTICYSAMRAIELRNRVTVQCEQCGTLIERKPSHVARRGHVFCSPACMGAWQSAHPRGQNKIQVPCSECKNPVMVWPSRMNDRAAHFCSRDCLAASQRKPEIHIVRECATCGASYQTTTHQVNTRGSNYCSKSCMDNGTRTRTLPYAFFWRRIAAEVRARDKYTCQLCGLVQKQPHHHVHHITPARTFGPGREHEANAMDNLISLCASCHRRVEHDPSLVAC